MPRSVFPLKVSGRAVTPAGNPSAVTKSPTTEPFWPSYSITRKSRLATKRLPLGPKVMLDGRIAQSGGPELADQLEEMGYDWLNEPETTAVGQV